MINTLTKYFREKFFIKLLLTYTLIIVFALSALGFIIIKSLYSSAERDATDVNNQIVQNVKSYFSQKYDKTKQILQSLYIDQEYYSDIFDLLQYSYDKLSPEYLSKRKLLVNFLNSSSLIDGDLSDIFILKQKDESLFYKNNLTSSRAQIVNLNIKWLKEQIDNKYFGLSIIPTSKIYFQTNTNANFIHDRYSIAANIKSKAMDLNLGMLALNFNIGAIKDVSSKVSQKYASTILVFLDSGELLFSSSPRSNKINYSDIYKLASPELVKNINSHYVTSIQRDTESGVVIASMINYSQVYGNVSKTKKLVILIMTLFIVIAVLLSIASISNFWKRVRKINSTINMIKSGNLEYRVQTSKSNDEINQIAENLNQMSDSLQDYISRVFLSDIKRKDSELKQKSAEMYALQSQINPHFLYNTLESIRMRALTYGAHDVSEMIRILAGMFRDSVKKKMIVGISEELGYCRSYLELFSIRYEEKLEYTIDIEKEIMDYGIIRHLFQPLIENSLIHGMNHQNPENIITIHGHLKNGSIFIIISDKGSGIPKEKLSIIQQQLASEDLQDQHVGIVNVNQRIKLIFGNEYGIKVESRVGLGTTVTMNIPALTIKEIEGYVQGITS